MPVDERTLAAEVAGWVTEILNRRPDLPFSRASVEEHVQGTARRHDFRLYRRHTDLPVLPGSGVCDDAVSSFDQYRQELRDRCSQLAQQRTPDQRRQRAIVDALLRRALQWRRA